MIDPVISPSGVTFDRAELLEQFEKIGNFDPFTRQPLYETDLIPNLALKECIDDYLMENPWCADF
jgi:STIP1 family protein 1